ncbi:MAG: DUF835 domain-containing protein [Methanothrix sp.]|nr:MAG: DUF835 domain-containing protein [Methanothrix sp.]
MIAPHVVLATMVLYLLLLFGIALYAYRQRLAGRSIVSNPYVYALSICVYATTWAFYGNVGKAASTGLSFLPIYLGPSLIMLLGWPLIRKMIRISKEYRLTTISDFISFRYGRSYAVGALVTIASLITITPYVALQLIAISESIDIIISGEYYPTGLMRLIVTILLGVFAIVFGARYLDPLERHEGLIAAVAFGSVVKLVAFLVAGIYIAYGIFGGYGVIVDEIATSPEYSHLLQPDYVSWFSLTFISLFAILFLPRQFHVMVVENSDENHLKKAMWLVPLYMLLINLFVPVVAWAGLLLDTPGSADMFMISIPVDQGNDLLALLVFIGGVSAAVAMVLVSAVALGTMMLNDLEMSHIIRNIGKGRALPSLLLTMRRLNILLVLALGYLYSMLVEFHSLVDIGLLSFLAVCQIAPAALGGMYWKKGSRYGAIAGLVSGFLIWGYTALVPSLVWSGWISERLLTEGPLGIGFLRPTYLFGLHLDMWTHAVFCSLFVNCLFYVFFSLIYRPSHEEVALADSVVDVYEARPELVLSERRMIRVGTVDELETTLARYIGEENAKRELNSNLAELNTTRESIDASELLILRERLEKRLTGTVGTSATRIIVNEEISVKPVVEVVRDTMTMYTLDPSRIYVIPEKAYEVFTDQIKHGIEGLCIASRDPDGIRSKCQFTETPIIRLSHDRGRGEMYIAPTNLPLLFITIKSFVEKSTNSIILLDNLDDLIEENASVVPSSEVLDFVYALESLVRENRTRFVLKVRPEYVHEKLSLEINEVRQLIFLLGPLSCYLLKAFADVMIASLQESCRREAIRDIEVLMDTDKLFEGIKCAGRSAETSPEARDPDMGMSAGSSDEQFVKIEPHLSLSRWELFMAVRSVARVIERVDPMFDLRSVLGPLMAKYGLKLYELDLIPSTTYVIEEEKPQKSLELFSDLTRFGAEGLCISRYHPDKLIEKYNFHPDMVIWLTQSTAYEAKYRCVDPTNFPRLSSIISDFLTNTKEPLILLEGMGYLITQSNYESVLRFIQSMRDEISMRKAILFIHLDPLALDTKELHRLKSEMEPLEL